MSESELRRRFDQPRFAAASAAVPRLDSGWCLTADRRQRVRLGFFDGDEAVSPLYWQAFGEPLLLVLADEVCARLRVLAPSQWPPLAELAMPFDVPTAKGGLQLAVQDAVSQLVAASDDRGE